jgi:hypothetical protein
MIYHYPYLSNTLGACRVTNNPILMDDDLNGIPSKLYKYLHNRIILDNLGPRLLKNTRKVRRILTRARAGWWMVG